MKQDGVMDRLQPASEQPVARRRPLIPMPEAFSAANRGGAVSGIWFLALCALTAMYLAEVGWLARLGLNTEMLALVIGVIYGNTLRHRLPETWMPGFQYASTSLLRLGILLYGFRLSLGQISEAGSQGSIIAVALFVTTLLVAWLAGRRWLKLDRDTLLLIGSGAAVGGAATVLATEAVTQSKPYKISLAVFSLMIFGGILLFLEPVLFNAGAFGYWTWQQFGSYVGGTVHDMGQVIEAGLGVNQIAAVQAIAVKSVRTLLLAPYLLALGWAYWRQRAAGAQRAPVPWFAIGLVLVILFSSLDIVPQGVLNFINKFSTFLLAMAAVALGAETSLGALRGHIRPVALLGAVLMLWLLVGGYFITWLVLRSAGA
jgi:uncharacterized integral membrane protein (TIGR00698 family)